MDADGDDLIDTNATLAVAGPAHGSGSAKKQKSAKAVADNEGRLLLIIQHNADSVLYNRNL